MEQSHRNKDIFQLWNKVKELYKEFDRDKYCILSTRSQLFDPPLLTIQCMSRDAPVCWIRSIEEAITTSTAFKGCPAIAIIRAPLYSAKGHSIIYCRRWCIKVDEEGHGSQLLVASWHCRHFRLTAPKNAQKTDSLLVPESGHPDEDWSLFAPVWNARITARDRTRLAQRGEKEVEEPSERANKGIRDLGQQRQALFDFGFVKCTPIHCLEWSPMDVEAEKVGFSGSLVSTAPQWFV